MIDETVPLYEVTSISSASVLASKSAREVLTDAETRELVSLERLLAVREAGEE